MNLRLISHKFHTDNRGKFMRIFDTFDFQDMNLRIEQTNFSVNTAAGTLRGMHFQKSGPPEWKIVTVLSGSVFMNIVDMRKSDIGSFKVQTLEMGSLTESVFIPSGFATGWISLQDNTCLLYQMGARFEDCTYSGFRYNDEKVNLSWPKAPKIISDQDLNWADLAQVP